MVSAKNRYLPYQPSVERSQEYELKINELSRTIGCVKEQRDQSTDYIENKMDGLSSSNGISIRVAEDKEKCKYFKTNLGITSGSGGRGLCW